MFQMLIFSSARRLKIWIDGADEGTRRQLFMPATRYESNCTRVCRAGMVVRGGGVLRTTSVLHLLYQSSNSPPLPFVTFSSLTLPNLVNLNFRVTINT